MPELPETETIARDLHAAVRGARIEAVRVPRPDVLRELGARAFAGRLKGSVIERCWRRAKLVVLDISGHRRLVVQPRFTGALLIDEGDLPDAERQYAAVIFRLDDDRFLIYRDIRRLGTVTLMDAARWAEYSGALGPEPLDAAFTPAHLSASLRGSSQAIKKALMDQRRIAGVGNIYANEALWRAGLDPSRAAASLTTEEVGALHQALTSVLRESIALRGTSFRDYRDAAGRRGAFAERLDVYGRGGLPCPRCGRRLVDTAAVDGRTTVFCPGCQGRTGGS
jgi:formamidopyrimidine-DNA glycosylase